METLGACAVGLIAGVWCLLELRRRARPAVLHRSETMRLLRRLLALVGGTVLVRWLSRLASWSRVGLSVSERAGEEVASAEKGIALVVVLSLAAGLLLSLLAQSPLGLALVPLAAFALVPAFDAGCERRRRAELTRAMPQAFRTLAVAMGSGETLSQAIAYVGSHQGGAVGKAFCRASLRLRCGQSAGEALGDLPDDLDAPGVGLLATVLTIAQRTGSPLKEMLGRAATLVERQGELERLLAVKTAQVRMSVRMVSSLPVVMLATLSLISPDFRQGLATPIGIACVVVAAVMDATALVIIRRLMKGVL